MTLPLPDWIPAWVSLALLALAVLLALAILAVPFAVFGLKGRLDTLEAQLDDIQTDLRVLAARMPDDSPSRPGRRFAASRDEPGRDEPHVRWPPPADAD
ncbi:hypothetical protein [Lichenicoccus sp.]|uniref:hypothetical protein n=1 Tax=Lichenicoccus sp. TaxID=2781899 RepID=UPI003D126C59